MARGAGIHHPVANEGPILHNFPPKSRIADAVYQFGFQVAGFNDGGQHNRCCFAELG